jgi:hypothetical protein
MLRQTPATTITTIKTIIAPNDGTPDDAPDPPLGRARRVDERGAVDELPALSDVCVRVIQPPLLTVV